MAAKVQFYYDIKQKTIIGHKTICPTFK